MCNNTWLHSTELGTHCQGQAILDIGQYMTILINIGQYISILGNIYECMSY